MRKLFIVLACCMLWTSEAHAEPPQPIPAPTVPAELAVPEGHVVVLRARAEGVQIYECKLKADKFQWILKTPEADLFDDNGDKIGTHSAGPTWTASDGSKVVGKLPPKAVARPGTVAWLLIEAKPSDQKKGTFARISHIQRVDTWAGRPPAKAEKADEGKTVRVKYEATYYFYQKK
jgi:hypothetical protein